MWLPPAAGGGGGTPSLAAQQPGASPLPGRHCCHQGLWPARHRVRALSGGPFFRWRQAMRGVLQAALLLQQGGNQLPDVPRAHLPQPGRWGVPLWPRLPLNRRGCAPAALARPRPHATAALLGPPAVGRDGRHLCCLHLLVMLLQPTPCGAACWRAAVPAASLWAAGSPGPD